MKHKALIFLSALFLSGCLVGPKVEKTEKTKQESFRTPTATGAGDSTAILKWAEVYQDTVLQALIRTALTKN